MSRSDVDLDALGRASRRAALLSLSGVVVVLISLGYSAHELNSLQGRRDKLISEIATKNQEISAKQSELSNINSDLSKAHEDLRRARIALEAVNTQNPGTRARVQYFPRTTEGERVKAALNELHFDITTGTPQNENAPTNTIWFGAPVSLSDVKIVAYALLQNGVEIKCIQPFRPNSKFHDEPLIQVGGYDWPREKQTLTLEGIRAARDFARCVGSGD